MIYLLRHTKPDIDSGICYGFSDIALHPDFESLHLPQVYAQLEGVKIDRVYSSPLKRCSELAGRVCEFLTIDSFSRDILLREMNFGDWELKLWNEIFDLTEGKAWFDSYLTTSTPNGESFVEMVARAERFFAQLHVADNENILLVTHAGFIRAAMVAVGQIGINDAFNYEVGYGEVKKIIDVR